jgi:hypothetical protein
MRKMWVRFLILLIGGWAQAQGQGVPLQIVYRPRFDVGVYDRLATYFFSKTKFNTLSCAERLDLRERNKPTRKEGIFEIRREASRP